MVQLYYALDLAVEALPHCGWGWWGHNLPSSWEEARYLAAVAAEVAEAWALRSHQESAVLASLNLYIVEDHQMRRDKGRLPSLVALAHCCLYRNDSY